MKDYRFDVSEIVRRKREFDEYYSQSYDDNNITISFPDPESSEPLECKVAEILESVEEVAELQGERNFYLTLCARNRLWGLASYVFRYSAIDYFLDLTPEDDISCFIEGYWDNSTLSSGEIYDTLIMLLPSYAEAIISQFELTNIDIKESLLEAFNNRNKSEFTRLLREEKGNVWRVSTICKCIKENSYGFWNVKNAMDVALVESNTDIIRNTEWNSKTPAGQRMLALLNLKELSERVKEGDEAASAALEREMENETYEIYIFCMKIFVNNKDSLNEEQQKQYQNLLQAPEFVSWYDKAYNMCVEEMTTDIKVLQSQQEWHLPANMFEKPKRFRGFAYLMDKCQKYISENPEKFEHFVEEVARHNIIDNTTTAKNTFTQIVLGIDLGCSEYIPLEVAYPQFLCYMVWRMYESYGYADLQKFFTYGLNKNGKEYDLVNGGKQYAKTCKKSYKNILDQEFPYEILNQRP